MIRILGILLLLIGPALLEAVSLAQAAEKKLDFTVDNTTFFKNLEYNDITEIVKGETFTGDIVKPYFTYHFKKGLQADVGGIFNIRFGDDDRVDRGDPWISLHYDFQPGWGMTAGTLDRNHPLLDALFNDDLEFTDPVEQGFQLRAQTEHLRQDLWIDWEQRETTARREKFSIGNYTQFRQGGFTIDGQVLWNHKGGQKNLAGEVDNNLGLAFGAGMTFGPSPRARVRPWVERFGVLAHYIYTKDKPRSLTETVEPDSTADGLLAEVFAVVGGAKIFFKVWEGSRDINTDNGQTIVSPPFLQGIRATKGDPLYREEDFIQFGFTKSWTITDEVDILAGMEVTRLRDQIVHVDTLSVRWRARFPLWEEKPKPMHPVRGPLPARPARPESPLPEEKEMPDTLDAPAEETIPEKSSRPSREPRQSYRQKRLSR